MTLKTFTTLIEGIQSHNKKVHDIYKLGIDLLPFNEDYYREVVRPLMVESFGEKGVDWINWYIYDRGGSGNRQAWDEDGNEICNNIESLYNTITK